jgi:glycosyltransferase involved in cell wall biosynthesis
LPYTQPEAFEPIAAQAQALGRPLIVSDIGGLSDMVAAPPDVEDTLRSAYRIEAGNPALLADHIALILNAPFEDLKNLAHYAQTFAAKRFSKHAVLDLMLQCYRALL